MRRWHVKTKRTIIFNKATLISADGTVIGPPVDCLMRFSAEDNLCELLAPLDWTMGSHAQICAVRFEREDSVIYVEIDLNSNMRKGESLSLSPGSWIEKRG